MQIRSTTEKLTGNLGRDVQIRTIDEKEIERTFHDKVSDGEVTEYRTLAAREFATLSLATHEQTAQGRKTTWRTLRVWNLDDHPNEAAIRIAKKGDRVTIEGYPEEHRYTDRETGEERIFEYLVVTSFRRTPGRLLRPNQQLAFA